MEEHTTIRVILISIAFFLITLINDVLIYNICHDYHSEEQLCNDIRHIKEDK